MLSLVLPNNQFVSEQLTKYALAPSFHCAVTDAQVKALVAEDTAGVWSKDTVSLHRISNPETDVGFKAFFTAYDNFAAIRATDVSSSGVSNLRLFRPCF